MTAGLMLVSTGAQADRVVRKGSDTLGAKLVPQLAEAFKAEHPDTTFDIAAEGSTTGIAAIIDGAVQLGMASRQAKPSEVGAASGKGVNVKPKIVAYDGIAVIVNSANPIKGLSRKQVEQIFTGDVTDWSAVGGNPGKISVYTRNTSSGTYSEFKELATKKRDYPPSAQKMAGNEQIASEVGKNANGHWLRRARLHESRRN
ncbi:MAG: substrate-binding domain-containing protein [Verrucomicrobiota bacterium]|nr:substrate-binding domain-containing protein [Verrucomicrobiota bacterium]